jgi:hypothetical protein
MLAMPMSSERHALSRSLTDFSKRIIGITPKEAVREEGNYGIYRGHIQDSKAVECR